MNTHVGWGKSQMEAHHNFLIKTVLDNGEKDIKTALHQLGPDNTWDKLSDDAKMTLTTIYGIGVDAGIHAEFDRLQEEA